MMDKESAKRIKDRNINWKEQYSEKSLPLKKRMDKVLGQGSYQRYEGHDFTTNSNYYVVIGPSVQHNQKLFFAGIKKLPREKKKKVYSPYGKYFGTIKAAMGYASRKWGVPFKQGVPDFTKEHLLSVKIPEHIKG